MSESYFNINKYIINFINNFENQDEIHKEKFISFLIKQSFDEKLDYMYVKKLVVKDAGKYYQNIQMSKKSLKLKNIE